jgi:hypothetical protein
MHQLAAVRHDDLAGGVRHPRRDGNAALSEFWEKMEIRAGT